MKVASLALAILLCAPQDDAARKAARIDRARHGASPRLVDRRRRAEVSDARNNDPRDAGKRIRRSRGHDGCVDRRKRLAH